MRRVQSISSEHQFIPATRPADVGVGNAGPAGPGKWALAHFFLPRFLAGRRGWPTGSAVVTDKAKWPGLDLAGFDVLFGQVALSAGIAYWQLVASVAVTGRAG